MKVIQLINKTLREKIRARRKRRKRSYFFITEAGRTPYEVFKALHGIEGISPRRQRIFDNGNDVHERLRDYLARQGVVKAKEVRIENRLFHGRADAILFENGRVAVLEIKSMRKQDYEKLKGYGTREAYLQIQLYMHFLKIDKGIILVECKNDQRLKAFHIKRKPRIAREQIRYFSRLKKKFVEAGVMAA